jgi:hypothetical protein
MMKMELNVELPFRLLVDVTFHYNEARFQYLFQCALCGIKAKDSDSCQDRSRPIKQLA